MIPIPNSGPNLSCPVGFKFIAEWILVPDNSASSATSDISTTDRSFEEIFLERIKGPSDKPPQKRRKVDLMTKVVSDKEIASEPIPDEEEGIVPFADETNSEVASDADEVESVADEVESNGDANPEDIFLPPKNEEEAITHLHAVWKSLNPPVPETNITDLWYGAVRIHGIKETAIIYRESYT